MLAELLEYQFASLSNLSMLKSINLGKNNLGGNIPSEFANMTSLEYLSLNSNQLTGEIPHELGNLPLLSRFKIDNNNLTGSIPIGLGSQINLSYVRLNNNNLSGCYPPNLATLCNDIETGNEQISLGNNFDTTWEDFCKSGNGVCDIGEEVNLGCTDELACNYDSNANYENASCIYYDIKLDCPCGTVSGCMDPEATNYEPAANCDNGFCLYEWKLLPSEYSIGLCYWFEFEKLTTLKKTCLDGTFSVTENTLNAIINISEDGDVHINEPENTEGIVKISLSNDNGCNSEWIFNIVDGIDCYGNQDSDNVFLTLSWLSNFVDPSYCNDEVIIQYPVYGVTEANEPYASFYIITSKGGVLYDSEGRFLCADYTEGETSCFNIFAVNDLQGVQSIWSCSDIIPLSGCIDPSACNFNSNAEIWDNSCEYLSCETITNPIKIKTTNEVILSDTQIKFDLVIDSLGLDFSADGLIFTLDTKGNYRIESIEVINPILSAAEVEINDFYKNTVSINRINNQRLASGEPILSATACVAVLEIQSEESTCSHFVIHGGTELPSGHFIDFDNIYIDIPFSDCSPYASYRAEGKNWLPLVLTINPQNCNTDVYGLAEIKILEEGQSPFTYTLKNEQGIVVLESTREEKLIELPNLDAGNYELIVFDMSGKKTAMKTCIPLVNSLHGNETCQTNCVDFVTIPNGDISGSHQAKKEIEIKGFVGKNKTVEFGICE